MWALVILSGCNNTDTKQEPPPQPNRTSQSATSNAFPLTLTDARGQTITLKAPPQRIVSLAPSNTELLFALGLGERIAGVTTACDYPPEAKQKPNIGGAYNMTWTSAGESV